MRRLPLVLALSASAVLISACASSGSWWPWGGSGMSYFVTSTNPGRGGDFGGLAGADRHCQALAASVGAGHKNWRAYLSTTGPGGVNARDRIGRGPWVNAKGETVASNIDELHGTNRLTKQTSITEKGEIISGRGDPVTMHDVLTGSSPDGRAMPGTADTTCGNWTRTGTEGAAIVGHHDRLGLQDDAPSRSWNSSHSTAGGCGMDGLKSTGGAGLLYCFAAN